MILNELKKLLKGSGLSKRSEIALWRLNMTFKRLKITLRRIRMTLNSHGMTLRRLPTEAKDSQDVPQDTHQKSQDDL